MLLIILVVFCSLKGCIFKEIVGAKKLEPGRSGWWSPFEVSKGVTGGRLFQLRLSKREKWRIARKHEKSSVRCGWGSSSSAELRERDDVADEATNRSFGRSSHSVVSEVRAQVHDDDNNARWWAAEENMENPRYPNNPKLSKASPPQERMRNHSVVDKGQPR